MSESCFKLIHFNRVRGVQHSPKHSLPTGPHKMVMRTLLSADNEIDAAHTDALAADRDWLLISLFAKCCTLEKRIGLVNVFMIVWLCLSGSVSTIEKLFTQNWAVSSADTERRRLLNDWAARLTFSVIAPENVSHLTEAKSKQQINLS